MQDLPEVGDSIQFHGWQFEVLEKDGHRVERVKISRIPDEE